MKQGRRFDGEVLFLIDSSTDVSELNYRRQKSFVVEMAKYLNTEPAKTRVGALVYSDSPSLQVSLGAQTSMDVFKQKVEHLPKFAGKRRVDKALSAASVVLSKARPSVPRIAVLLISGNQAEGEDFFSRSIEESLIAGIETYIVTIGSQVNLQKLRSLVAKPDDIFPVKTFDNLQKEAKPITEEILEGK